MIDSFKGRYSFLSNFEPCLIEFEGLTFRSVEHAYQAAKTNDKFHRTHIHEAATAALAKKRGNRVPLRPDWNDVRVDLMLSFLRQKFGTCYEFARLLLETGDQELVEGNYWHDQFWGNCTCAKHKDILGENNLGKLLMQLRDELRFGPKKAEE